MKNPKTKNLSLSRKTRRMKEQFPDLSISRALVHKVLIFIN